MNYWRTGYNWRSFEARLNRIGQFRTTIDDLGIHFLHRRSARADATPLILTHGWPGSIAEFIDVVDELADPKDAEAPAFHVVVPSLPGFGYSDKPATTGWGTEKIAAAWVELMGRLGYSKFAAHGGDWGGVITTVYGFGERKTPKPFVAACDHLHREPRLHHKHHRSGRGGGKTDSACFRCAAQGRYCAGQPATRRRRSRLRRRWLGVAGNRRPHPHPATFGL